MKKNDKKNEKNVATPESSETDKIANLFKKENPATEQNLTALESAALRDEWLDRRNLLVRSIVDQTENEISAISTIKDNLRRDFGSKFSDMVQLLERTEAAEKMTLSELEGVMKFSTRLLYANEYSNEYMNPQDGSNRVPLTSAELKERMAAFCGLVLKMGLGYKPSFYWASKGDGIPKVTFTK